MLGRTTLITNRLPDISNKHKICIICEGNEEYKYLEKLRELHVWSDVYDISLVNAEGNGNIPARYQDRYQNGSYEAVLVFCDTEKKPYEQYEDIKRKINEFHGIDGAADEVVIFANPCTMQIVSKHWTDELIASPAKKVNAPLIEKYTGVKNYKGRADQIDKILESITTDGYNEFRQRIRMTDDDDGAIGGTNFGLLLDRIENDDARWLDEFNSIVEGENDNQVGYTDRTLNSLKRLYS